MSEKLSDEQLEKYALRDLLYKYSKEELEPILAHEDTSPMVREVVQQLLDAERLTSSNKGYIHHTRIEGKWERTVTAAGRTFSADEMFAPTKALGDAGFDCDEATAAKLWSRFSKDQCATWMSIEAVTLERFVAWMDADLDPEEAWL